MKYRIWLDEWLKTCIKPRVKQRTLKRYSDIVRLQIEPKLGNVELTALTPTVLQNFIADLTVRYSANTVTGVISVLKGSLSRAQKMTLVKKQYSDAIEYPKPEEKIVKCFTRAEQKLIERAAFESNKPKLFGFVLCLYTGLRIGELLALEWNDLDLINRRITVSKTCEDKWENGKYIKQITSPKTAASVRVIPIPPQLIPYIKSMKKYGKSRYVICGKAGKDVSVRSYQKSFYSTLKNINVNRRGFHTLRHTFATRALECGMDVKTLSKILGHNSPVVTLRRYAHSLWEHQDLMMNKLGKMLYSNSL